MEEEEEMPKWVIRLNEIAQEARTPYQALELFRSKPYPNPIYPNPISTTTAYVFSTCSEPAESFWSKHLVILVTLLTTFCAESHCKEFIEKRRAVEDYINYMMAPPNEPTFELGKPCECTNACVNVGMYVGEGLWKKFDEKFDYHLDTHGEFMSP